jgi:hypothetical protein
MCITMQSATFIISLKPLRLQIMLSGFCIGFVVPRWFLWVAFSLEARLGLSPIASIPRFMIGSIPIVHHASFIARLCILVYNRYHEVN